MLSPISLIWTSFSDLHSGLNVRATDSTLTTRFVKNFAARVKESGSAFFGHAIPDSSSSSRESLLHKPSSDSMLVRSTGRGEMSACVLDGGFGRPTSDKALEGKQKPVLGQGQKSSTEVEGVEMS